MMCATGALEELEVVDNVQSIDTHALLAQLVGAVQAQGKAHAEEMLQLKRKNEVLVGTVEAQGNEMKALKQQNEVLSQGMRELRAQLQALTAK